MCNLVTDEQLMKLGESVVDLAISNVNAGGLPFSAIIFNQEGRVIGRGVNQVATHLDCTAHAEIQAIRNASHSEKNITLKGATLIASGEPCALCYMAILTAEIKTVMIVSDRHEAKKYGFDYQWTYEYLNTKFLHELSVVKLDIDRKLLPFKLGKIRLSDSSF